MKNIIAYNSVYYFDREFSNVWPSIKHMHDVKLFGGLFYLYARNMSINDRTETIKIPLKTSVLDCCRLPEFVEKDVPFEQVCNDRARLLMDQAIAGKRKLAIMWSGGVDSTLIATSILKNCTRDEIAKHVVVLMSQDSIIENPKFYDNHILPNFELMPANNFAHIIGNDDYFYVTGEGNDQLFASLFVIEAYKIYWEGKVSPHDSISDDNMIPFIKHRTKFSTEESTKLYRILQKLCDASPVKITTPYQFFWWCNFALKWQNVYVRSMLFAHPINRAGIKMEENYTTFFHNDDFQLWTMNTIHKHGKISKDDSNSSYKEVCKEIIFDFDKNQDYRNNKNKYGSFGKVIMSKHASNFVTENIKFYTDLDFMQAYEPNNDFT
jgi:hypothetical protein